MIVSHYSPHNIARLCFSHETTNRPSGCQATALTIDLKEKKTETFKSFTKFNDLFRTNSNTNWAYIISFVYKCDGAQNKNKTITSFERYQLIEN